MNPIFLFTSAFLCSQLGIRIIPVASKSTIKIGEEVNSTSLSNLVSDGGNFNLGFITIRETNYNYFGIWYTNDRQQRQVWVANPNNPMTDDSGILTIDTNGQLKIMNRGSTILNISYPQVGTRNTTAKLQDSGNFVLMDEAENTVLWQSFDHPTNTLLPGMKIGANFSTGRNWTLNSWLSDFVPASGAFTLSWEPIQGSGQFVILRRGELYWTRTFEDISPSFFPLYNYSHVRDSNSNYFTLSIQDGNFPMWFLSPKGEIIDIANNNNRITPYDFCYGDEEDNGCVISGLPNCRSHYDKFEEQNANILASASVNDDNSSLSIGDCMQRCWRNCSCIGFASNSNGTGCIIFMGPAEYRVVPADNTQYKYQLTSQRPPKGEKRIWIWIIVAVVLVFMLALSSLCYLRRKRQRPEVKEKKRQEEYLLELTASDSLKNVDEVTIDGSEGHDHDLKLFSFASIKAATNDFSHQNKLGEGGFGPVYKGKLANGREIAVKRLSRTSGQGIVEFKNELILIAKLQHTNLVRMLGCCIYGEEKMLIYEYMPNKSLDSFLFEQSKKELLDWQLRWNIIEGVAQGLLYLHKYSRMRVIHRDLKASNVLLDDNMNPKIADFGMARIFKQNETEAVTNRVVGTYGYMSPEYAMEGAFSVKSDVFSFGVLVLEIVSGRRNTSFYHFDRPLNLIGYAWELWKEGVPLELKDPAISGSCAVPQLLRAIHVGLLCVQENATDRPTMSDVVSMLSNETMPLPSPKQPAFFTGRRLIDSITYEGKSKATSVNDLTFTVMEAR